MSRSDEVVVDEVDEVVVDEVVIDEVCIVPHHEQISLPSPLNFWDA
jgi:hypothetical protein